VTERAVRLGGGAALAIAQLEEAGELIEQVINALARKGA
jgi:hypothetical protein